MTIEKYNSAKAIRENIDGINLEIQRIENLMKKYIEDSDLQFVLQFTSAVYINKIEDLEREFLIL